MPSFWTWPHMLEMVSFWDTLPVASKQSLKGRLAGVASTRRSGADKRASAADIERMLWPVHGREGENQSKKCVQVRSKLKVRWEPVRQ